MRPKKELKIIITLLVIAVICLFILVISGSVFGYSWLRAESWVKHTDEVKAQIENFNRVYTIADDAGKIAYYEEGQNGSLVSKRRLALDETEKLRKITYDNVNQHENIDTLSEFVNRRFAIQDEIIKTAVRDGAGRIVLDNDKLKLSASIVSKVIETTQLITGTETNLMIERRKDEARFRWWVGFVVVIFFCLTTVFIAVFAFFAIKAIWKTSVGVPSMRKMAKSSSGSISAAQVEAFADYFEGLIDLPETDG